MEAEVRKQDHYKGFIKAALSAVLWGAMVGIWAFIWMRYYSEMILRPFGYKGNWLVFAVYGLLLYIFANFYGAFRIGFYRKDDIILSGIISILITNGVTYLQTCLIGRAIMQFTPFLIMTALDMVVLVLWAFVADSIYQRLFPPRRLLMVYGRLDSALILQEKMNARKEKYRVEELLPCDGDYKEICEKAASYEGVVLCDMPPKERNTLLKYCFEKGIRTYTTPKIADVLIRGGEHISLFDMPVVLNRNVGLSLSQRFVKRMEDLILSSIGLVIAAPFMLVVAVAIKASDGGTVLFKQKRLTRDQKEFEIYKFRSMVMDAEKEGKPLPAIDDDPRITKVGKVLRAMRMDELPQIFNILKGEMSIVGPRPERVEHVDMYTQETPEFLFRYKVKAGLTGYAQIFGKYNTSAYDKLKLDLMYITRYSLVEDIKLILMTIKILFSKNSTEGMERPVTEEREAEE